MNAFILTAQRHTGDTRYLASRDRIELHGEQGLIDRISILCAMLKRISLCPRHVKPSLRALKAGTVHLHFFGYSSPVPMFSIDPAQPGYARLRQAVAENLRSTKFDAAKRVLKWRGRSAQSYRRTQLLIDGFSTSLDWSVAGLHEEQRRIRNMDNRHQLDLFANQLREHRHARLRVLSVAAAGTYGWTDLLSELAHEAFTV